VVIRVAWRAEVGNREGDREYRVDFTNGWLVIQRIIHRHVQGCPEGYFEVCGR
jgi:hypothetical protein